MGQAISLAGLLLDPHSPHTPHPVCFRLWQLLALSSLSQPEPSSSASAATVPPATPVYTSRLLPPCTRAGAGGPGYCWSSSLRPTAFSCSEWQGSSSSYFQQAEGHQGHGCLCPRRCFTAAGLGLLLLGIVSVLPSSNLEATRLPPPLLMVLPMLLLPAVSRTGSSMGMGIPADLELFLPVLCHPWGMTAWGLLLWHLPPCWEVSVTNPGALSRACCSLWLQGSYPRASSPCSLCSEGYQAWGGPSSGQCLVSCHIVL